MNEENILYVNEELKIVRDNLYLCFDEFIYERKENAKSIIDLPDVVFYDKDFNEIWRFVWGEDELGEDFEIRFMSIKDKILPTYVLVVHWLDDDDNFNYFCTISDDISSNDLYHLKGCWPGEDGSWRLHNDAIALDSKLSVVN